jgi:hypothetical protein
MTPRTQSTGTTARTSTRRATPAPKPALPKQRRASGTTGEKPAETPTVETPAAEAAPAPVLAPVVALGHPFDPDHQVIGHQLAVETRAGHTDVDTDGWPADITEADPS